MEAGLPLHLKVNMAENAPTAKSLAEFRAINDDYQQKIQSTHEKMGKAWPTYMEQHRDPIAKRRRCFLGTIVDLFPMWREMENNAEVVLGSGNMVEQEPLYRIINSVNWPNPDSSSFAILIQKLNNIMTRVGEIIDKEVKLSVDDAAAMGREIAHLNAPTIADDEEKDDSTSEHDVSSTVGKATDENAHLSVEDMAAMGLSISHLDLQSSEDDEEDDRTNAKDDAFQLEPSTVDDNNGEELHLEVLNLETKRGNLQ